MIFPEEYKNIGICHENDDISSKIYFLSEYLLKQEDGQWNLYQVNSNKSPILTTVESLELIATSDQILWYDKKLNIKDRTLLIETANKFCTEKINTVIFTGIDEHVTFVHQPDITAITTIEVLDIEPPLPWLADCIQRLERSGIFSDLQIRFEYNITNLKQFEDENTVFPCCCSGLKGQFLDSSKIEGTDLIVIGCEISDTILKTKYPTLKYERYSFCPFSSDLVKPNKMFIARCCRKEMCGPTTINGYKGTVVHWGATEHDIAVAVRNLVRNGVLES